VNKPLNFEIIKARWLVLSLICAFICTVFIIGALWPNYFNPENVSPIITSVMGILLYFIAGVFIYCSTLKNNPWKHSIAFCTVGTLLHITGSGPAIIGTIFLIVGLALCAKAKGRNPAWGLMGFFWLIGILVLIFLKDKREILENESIEKDLFSIGVLPSKKDIRMYALLGIPMVGISLFSLMIIFIPLSYLYPEFVKFWLLDESNRMIYLDGEIESTICTILNILLIVIIAPITEELFFRGYLLNRWKNKFNAIIAVVLTSFLFALLHADLLGAFIFSAILSLVYLKTKSIYGPVIIHFSNNTLALIFMFIAEIQYELTSTDLMLIEFQNSWWIGLIGVIISIPWLVWFLKEANIFSIKLSSSEDRTHE
tara:strand:+ start:150 stop:1259 length:1110 start_codon:yes stop_codon:yes gene_type:complete